MPKALLGGHVYVLARDGEFLRVEKLLRSGRTWQQVGRYSMCQKRRICNCRARKSPCLHLSFLSRTFKGRPVPFEAAAQVAMVWIGRHTSKGKRAAWADAVANEDGEVSRATLVLGGYTSTTMLICEVSVKGFDGRTVPVMLLVRRVPDSAFDTEVSRQRARRK